MEATSLYHHTNIHKLKQALFFNRTLNPNPRTYQTKFLVGNNLISPTTRLSLQACKNHGLKNKCLAPSSGSAVVEISPEEEEEWTRMTEKCRERKGLVELLECLETEAIMGEDEGKEPKDYNRRARIFDKSSRVFQALKEHNGISSNSQD